MFNTQETLLITLNQYIKASMMTKQLMQSGKLFQSAVLDDITLSLQQFHEGLWQPLLKYWPLEFQPEQTHESLNNSLAKTLKIDLSLNTLKLKDPAEIKLLQTYQTLKKVS